MLKKKVLKKHLSNVLNQKASTFKASSATRGGGGGAIIEGSYAVWRDPWT
ncbi:MAG: hypothetical protein IKE45_16050 [Halomonas sp.]|nr:hypothetical protein [Halomonas sp.]MBR2515494.1 hypothetical protein [Halomonas sp.]